MKLQIILIKKDPDTTTNSTTAALPKNGIKMKNDPCLPPKGSSPENKREKEKEE